MTSPDQGVSVVICAYTEARWDALIAAVESVRSQTVPAREIIVVSDHNDRLRDRVRAALPGTVVVENSGPQGLAAARNSGVAVAQGAVIAFLDDDAVAAPDWLAVLLSGYADPRVIGVGGAIEPLWEGRRPAWFPAEFGWVVGCTYRGMPRTATPVRNLIGCNMSFRQEVFATSGGFRSGIGRVGTRPVGCEETEFCIRLAQARPGDRFLYQPRARVEHRVPAIRAGWAYFASRCYAEGLSKALVAGLVGAGDGLASERTYTMQTLPRGVIGGLGAAARGDLAGLGRAGAIVAGLAMTSAGYVAGTLARRRARGPASGDAVPVAQISIP